MKALTTQWIRQHRPFSDDTIKCPAGVILAVLFFAAAQVKSVSDACGRLAGVPSDETLRQALLAIRILVAPPIDAGDQIACRSRNRAG